MSGNWKSGTQDLTNDFDKPKVNKPIRIHKTLHPPVRMYKKIINEAGHLNLAIGSQWKKVLGNKETTILCKKEATNEKYTPELKANNVSANFDSYFDLVSQEVWICLVYEGDMKETIRRVVSTFKIDYEKIKQFSVKHLYFYDGIAVSYGKYKPEGKPETSILEIGEVKYLDSTDNTVLKYEGLTKLSEGLATNLSNNRLLSNGEERRDFVLHDVLGADGVFKTDVGSSGIIVEAGAKIPEDAELILDNLECTYQEPTSVQGYSQELLLNQYYVTKIFHYGKDGNTNFVKRTEVPFESFASWFERIDTSSNGEQIMHTCKSKGNTYLRVMTRLVFLSSINLAAVYHYDGVTIHTHPNQQSPEITEVKFYKQQGSSMELVKFDGFVSYKKNENQPRDRSVDYVGSGTIHEIRYYLDTPILHFKEGFHVERGVAIEIGSQPEETFETLKGEKVICVEVKDQQLQKIHATKVFTNFPVDVSQATRSRERKGRGRRSASLPPTPTPSTSPNRKHWAAINKDFNGHFYERSQRLWTCTKESELVFHAVINVMVMADELHLARVFLRDGVKVDVVTLPDNLKIIETTELKFFTVDEQSNIKIISYVGDIVFETTEHPILGKLFSGSYESKINRLFSEEAIVEEGYSYIQLLAYYHIVEGFNKKLSGNGNSSTSNKGVPSAPIPETITYMPKGETKIKDLDTFIPTYELINSDKRALELGFTGGHRVQHLGHRLSMAPRHVISGTGEAFPIPIGCPLTIPLVIDKIKGPWNWALLEVTESNTSVTGCLWLFSPALYLDATHVLP
ncbi:uncharacterized protein LOC111054392 [Nilaparvata lugens]|uniref:uncharacterized protein LOC111054392 n=1 Tax=Nilaparvata lugens TaxID=108931 RepID=UPI00193CDC73|nr:uncharacterized protein LOC111054392 [Nilaparvata lugens]